ncbi:MAG: UDP-N-acetylglucosamine 1-carboxyvinyltransferase [Bdellovibrionales bacterium]|nr:UDP-N-acetylglucosamine 1-carboxyvinyltransferase [Bdellovibrionales bacterium]
MSEILEIHGGRPLSGEVTVSGAKNAALPIMLASMLTSDEVVLRNVPNLTDVHLSIHLLEHFGAEVDFVKDTLRIKTPRLIATEASYSLVKALRASFWVLGPLLARGGAARVALPGGDVIGARPVDIHLEALTQMGADIHVKHGVVMATAPDGLRPAELDFRFPSVGATHQVLMAAALTPGRTVIRGAAREPEVIALADFLVALGAEVEGAGQSTIVIEGKESLHGCDFHLIGDRIEAATYILAVVATKGSARIRGFDPEHLGAFLDTLRDMGVEYDLDSDGISILSATSLRPVHVSTGPFPQFATDIQALLMAATSVLDGVSHISEQVFEGRFSHVSELARMGAQISVEGRTAHISGVSQLSGAYVEARDIRAGAALCIAGLAAEGVTQIADPQHLRRGYTDLETKLQSLGARVGHKVTDAEDFMFSGC